jgi:radical SAM protein with 4Fe4S-binding SPASM domain
MKRDTSPEELAAAVPVYAVWELTTRCDQPCQHCGTRAGTARAEELGTEKITEVAQDLASLGCREVTLIGGEAYLRADVYTVVRTLSGLGLRVTMQTGGRALTPERIGRFKEAGLAAIGVSVDGVEETHDRLRGNRGSHAAALAALENARAAGFIVTANTQINRLTQHVLPETSALLRDRGVIAWQVQFTTPMGNAADHPEWLIDPPDVVPVIDTLAAIQLDAIRNPRPHELPAERRAFNIQPGNNVGYYGPHEQVLRSRPHGSERYWAGCTAGRGVIGIESDGTVKGCPSLPTGPYQGGNVLQTPLREIWRDAPALNFTRDRGTEELWGFCKGCYYADLCKGGCSFTSHTLLGRRGNNPWCYYRATQLRARGVRERLVQVEKARGERYDFGRFEVVEEPIQPARAD